jgi:hypothetical protein
MVSSLWAYLIREEIVMGAIRNYLQDHEQTLETIIPIVKGPKFAPGSLYMTPGVQKEIDIADLTVALRRHGSGDWGDVGPEDWQANEDALKNDLRLFSVYHSSNGTKFWIITEWDRSVTTALLPSEY